MNPIILVKFLSEGGIVDNIIGIIEGENLLISNRIIGKITCLARWGKTGSYISVELINGQKYIGYGTGQIFKGKLKT